MIKYSAGILMYRYREGSLEVLLVHPGGPYWAKKDLGAWSIPKGIYDIETESPLDAAKREFTEETGFTLEGTAAAFIPLESLKQPSGKIIRAWAVEGNLKTSRIKSNFFSMEWPPHSGKQQEFPEVDRAGWFDIETAKIKILKGQSGFINKLIEVLVRDR